MLVTAQNEPVVCGLLGVKGILFDPQGPTQVEITYFRSDGTQWTDRVWVDPSPYSVEGWDPFFDITGFPEAVRLYGEEAAAVEKMYDRVMRSLMRDLERLDTDWENFPPPTDVDYTNVWNQCAECGPTKGAIYDTRHGYICMKCWSLHKMQAA